jgi:hypothetical protein
VPSSCPGSNRVPSIAPSRWLTKWVIGAV